MKKPKIIDELEDRVAEILSRDDSPFIDAKTAGELLGCDATSITNAAENNNLPFGFMHSQGKGYRRYVVIPKVALWHWLAKEGA